MSIFIDLKFRGWTLTEGVLRDFRKTRVTVMECESFPSEESKEDGRLLYDISGELQPQRWVPQRSSGIPAKAVSPVMTQHRPTAGSFPFLQAFVWKAGPWEEAHSIALSEDIKCLFFFLLASFVLPVEGREEHVLLPWVWVNIFDKKHSL